MVLVIVHALRRQQLRPRSRMAWLAAALAATAFAALRRLESRAIAGGWFGGVAGAAADPLAQLSQFRRQGGELGHADLRSLDGRTASPAAETR